MKKLHAAIAEFKRAAPAEKPLLVYDPVRNTFFVSYYFSAAYVSSKGMVVYEKEVKGG